MVSLCRGMDRRVDGKRKECVVIGWLEGGLYESEGRRGK